MIHAVDADGHVHVAPVDTNVREKCKQLRTQHFSAIVSTEVDNDNNNESAKSPRLGDWALVRSRLHITTFFGRAF